jgi:hypothetical protein
LPLAASPGISLLAANARGAVYWVTFTVTVFDVMVSLPLTYCAYTVVLPAVVDDWTHIGSSLFSTETRVVLFETQVTVAVTSCSGPLESVASTVKHVVAVELTGRLTEPGVTVKAVTSPNVMVALAVALAVPEDAVIVALPTVIPFSSPPEVIVAILGSELDQQTEVPEQVVPPVKV